MSRTHVKSGAVAHVCSLGAPIARWGAETGRSTAAYGPASLVCVALKKGRASHKTEDQHLRFSFNF